MAKYELSLTVNSANADVLTLDSDNFVLDVTPQAPVSLSVLELVGPRGETGPAGPTGPTGPVGATTLAALTDVDSTSIVGEVLQSDGDGTFSFVDVVTAVDLGYTPTATTGTVTNDAGTDATIPAATTTNAGLLTGGDKTKLDGIETLADVTDATNVAAAGAVMDSDIGSTVQAHSTVLDNTTASYTTAEETKLSGIEALADVTDATNVAAAGAVMESDTSTVNMSFVVDEDDMVSNSDTKVPTQQSVKAYVDANGGGSGDVVDDLTPQLGGDLDVNGNSIVSVSGGDIAITPNGDGQIVLDGLNWPISDGTDRQVLVTDGSGELTFDDIPPVQVDATNNTASDIAAGTPVHQTGVSGQNITIAPADASSASTMPAIGVTKGTISASGGTGVVVVSGFLKGINTSTYTAGDTLYVADGGGFATSPPVGEENLIENLGKVVKSDANAGSIIVTGAGRANATPNLDDGKIFIGNSGNQAGTSLLSTEVGLLDLSADKITSGTLASARLPDLAVSDFAGSAIVTELEGLSSSDNDTSLPTTAAVIDYVANNAAGGDVSKVGTPVDNQIGVWTGDGTIEGDADLTWDGSAFDITGDLTVSGTINDLEVGLGGGSVTGNTAVGVSALNSNTTGSNNTAFGFEASRLGLDGIRNTALGYKALRGNTAGDNNTAIGFQSMLSATGSNNVGIGLSSLQSSTGNHNLALGSQTLKSANPGSYNTAIGSTAMNNASNGSSNVGIGRTALSSNSGNNNVGLGEDALRFNTSGGNNIAIGTDALRTKTTGDDNIGIGRTALTLLDGADDNVAIGGDAGDNLTTGSVNTLIGYGSQASTATVSNEITLGGSNKSFRIPGSSFYINGGSEGTTGSRVGINTTAPTEQLDVSGNAVVSGTINTLQVNNGNGDEAFSTAVGVDALISANSGAIRNTAIGRSALEDNTSGQRNTAIGTDAMSNATTGGYNTAIGELAMGSGIVTGYSNSAIGATALQSLTSGIENMAVGRGSLAFNTTGLSNVAIGRNALYQNTTGSFNVALGSNALKLSSIGAVNFNVAIGQAALDKLNPGQNSNIAIGYGAGRDLRTGTQNTIIGYEAEASTATVSNEITFGINTGSKSFRIPGSSFYINGGSEGTVGSRVGINTTAPTEQLDVNADAIRIRTAQTPASATAAGEAGTVCWDANYVYICVATNTWKRAALSTW